MTGGQVMTRRYVRRAARRRRSYGDTQVLLPVETEQVSNDHTPVSNSGYTKSHRMTLESSSNLYQQRRSRW